jgi:hypothetical protein
MKLIFLYSLILFGLRESAYAASKVPVPSAGSGPAPLFRIESDYLRNGIGVGQPKVFDNRSLVLMLEEMDASLRQLNAIDQAKILGQIGSSKAINNPM